MPILLIACIISVEIRAAWNVHRLFYLSVGVKAALYSFGLDLGTAEDFC